MGNSTFYYGVFGNLEAILSPLLKWHSDKIWIANRFFVKIWLYNFIRTNWNYSTTLNVAKKNGDQP